MYLVEGSENGFTSIPRGMYWAIVTMTTVGYGDIAPHTVPGQIIATLVMILGYGIIAVPTGIVSAELVHTRKGPARPLVRCAACDTTGHDIDATYCKHCGASL
jgi:voltage-gated potassium channel